MDFIPGCGIVIYITSTSGQYTKHQRFRISAALVFAITSHEAMLYKKITMSKISLQHMHITEWQRSCC